MEIKTARKYHYNTIVAIASIFFLILNACKTADSIQQDDLTVVGLSSPIQLNLDTTLFYIEDYYTNHNQVDSLSTKGLKVERNKNEVRLISTAKTPTLGELMVWSDGKASVIPFKKSKLQSYTFTFDPKGRKFKSLQMKGEMNSWNVNANPLVLKDGKYTTELLLEPKAYQYVMVIDGVDQPDFNNPNGVSNGMGGTNSLLNPYGKECGIKLHLSTTDFDDEKIEITANQQPDNIIALWQNRLLEFVQDGNTIEFKIPVAAKKMERSFVRVYAAKGKAMYNDVLVPLDHGEPIEDEDQLNRMDKHALSLYNVFIDRFHNGDTSNDRPLNLPSVHPRADDHGGDISGTIQKLKEGFFEALGINTIWISPIVKNVEGAYGKWPNPETQFSAYHGYWPVSFTLIDDRKGTPEELHELVDLAHKKGMNVLLDFVANHVHEEHPWYKANKNLATDLYLPDGRMNTELWDEHRLTTWFDVFLPSLKLDEPEVYEMLTDSAVFWIKEYNLDGFRHDATKHVPEIFWRTLTKKLKNQVIIPEGRDLYQIGETYGTRELVGSYVNSGQLDAQFDFNMYDATVNALARKDGSFKDLNKAIELSLDAFGHHHLMGNITGNQDKGRFISYAGGALKFDENPKVAGWTREIGVGDDIAYKKSELLMGVVATIPGLPVIYYGDEIGSFGGNDPDNRKMMQFDNLSDKQKGIQEIAKEVLNFRKHSLPLIYGDFQPLIVEENVYAFSRSYFDESVIVVFNKSNQTKTVSLNAILLFDEADALFDSELETEGKTIKIELAGNSFEIIELN